MIFKYCLEMGFKSTVSIFGKWSVNIWELENCIIKTMSLQSIRLYLVQ
ncbi:hypothetical protein F1003_02370 [Winogradskyella sp. ZXX205]|uniref:Uncharacterized protein n=1 Tax=Winogradskyella ouciana TaxID=2608631 RepID=A0A7K1G9P4_9FLAO|nr:hypothetical protein [Winogradskyella ouciana]